MALWLTVRKVNEGLKDRSSCYYCGEPSECEDHAIPHALVRRLGAARSGYGTDTLPACHECNTLLGAQVFDTLEDRTEYICTRLKQRYSKEIEGEAYNRRKAQIDRRLGYMKGIKPIAHVTYTPITTSKRIASSVTTKPVPIVTLPPRPQPKRVSLKSRRRWYVNDDGLWDYHCAAL